MSLQYIKDDKGKDQLLYKGYLYKKVRASGNKTFWKCAEYHKYCCTGRAHTSHNQVIKSLPHLHPPTRMPTEAEQVPYGMKKTTLSPESIPKMNTASCNALSEVRTKKWCTNHPSQTIQRLRACLKATRQSSPNLREPAVETTIKEPIIPSALTSPGFHEFTDSSMDGGYRPSPFLRKEKHALNSPSIQANREAGRQRFRLSTLLPGETLQEILSRLSTTALQWLCPQEHSKDQIVDMVILEQFLNVLPADMQTWLKAQEPGSSKEAVHLAMAYHKQEPAKPIQDMITFEDVSIHFTEEEWSLLYHKEKNLYWNVMHQNYDNVAYLASDQIKGKSQEEEPLQEVSEPAVEWLEKSKEVILQHPKQKLNKNCPKNQQKTTLQKEAIFTGSKRNVMGPDRDIILQEVGLQSQCMHIDYGEGGASAIPINDQKRLKEEDITEKDNVVHIDDLRDENYQPSLDRCKKQAQPRDEDLSQIGPKRIRKAAKREILLCDYDGCGKIFSNRQYLNYHKKYRHVHQETFTCSDPSCGKSFNFKKHLKEHEKLHSDKRDYICEFCTHSFRSSSNLTVHRRIHTGEKPLQCEICGFTCRQKASLNWHMKKHDADSSYQFSCDLCGKKFEKKDNVTAHKSKSHRLPVALFEC